MAFNIILGAAMPEKLYFEPIKEHRGSYFVEYQPPIAGQDFACLNLVFPGTEESSEVAALMEKELRHWLSRYPVPLMIWAWDSKEDMITPEGQSETCLVGWSVPGTGEVGHSWNIDDLTAFQKSAPPHPDWRTIYADVPFRTDAQVKADAMQKLLERGKQVRILKIIFVTWVAVIPASLAVVEFLGPQWLGYIVLGYSLWKAWRAGMKIWGHSKPTPREEEKAEKQRKMDHYFYHCELNPDGFSRLKIENFEKDSRERIRKEAEQIAGKRGV